MTGELGELHGGYLNSSLFITSLATRLFTFVLNVIVGVVFRQLGFFPARCCIFIYLFAFVYSSRNLFLR